MAQAEAPIAAYKIDAGEDKPEANSDSDEDYAMDENEEKMMRQMAEMRMAAMKEEFAEKQINKTLGHGTYSEITEQEFLPLVTKTKYVVVAFFHKDF